MAKCTILKWFGLQDWFDSKFLDLCDKHDEYYVMGCPYWKFYSDFWIAVQFTKRGYWWLGILSLPYTLFCGTLFWLYHRISDLIKRVL